MNTAPLPPDPYKALGVEKNADAGAIKTAYRKLVLKCHPDKFPDPTLKAIKQEEFQRVQQAYEIIGTDDKKAQYDLEVKARQLRAELYSKNTPQSNTSSKRQYDVNVRFNVRTAEPPSSFAAPIPPSAKTYKPYSDDNPEFTKSWERDIPNRSKVFHDEDRKARRTASYEKPRREEESKEEKRRRQDQEREYKEKERDMRRREKERGREREREREREKERKLDWELRAKAEAKAEKKRGEREPREKERERQRKLEAEDKLRASKSSSKSYAEPYIEENEEEFRRSRAKKSSSKKHGDSPTRKSSSKHRERSIPRADAPPVPPVQEKFHSHLEFAAQYLQASKRKVAGKSASPTHQPEVTPYASAYPDPEATFHVPKTPRRSGEGKHFTEEPTIIDVPSPGMRGPDAAKGSPVPPRLHKSNTMPAGYMPQAQAPPHRIPLGRSYTMQPEQYERSGHQSAATPEKHSSHKHSSRRRASFDEDFYDDEPRSAAYPPVSKTSYKIGVEKGAPRVYESARTTRYKNPYVATPGATFGKVKVASYGLDNVQTSKHYGYDDVQYFGNHLPPEYAAAEAH